MRKEAKFAKKTPLCKASPSYPSPRREGRCCRMFTDYIPTTSATEYIQIQPHPLILLLVEKDGAVV